MRMSQALAPSFGRPRRARQTHSHRVRPVLEMMEGRLLLAQITIDLNGTGVISDDITLFNPSTGPLPFTQTITAVVTDTGAAGVFDMTANPATDVSFNVTQLKLAMGGKATVTITPLADSKMAKGTEIMAVDDATKKVVGMQPLTIVSVTFAQHIRNSDTPTAMNDRIPPTALTPVDITVTPDLTGSGLNVPMTVIGQDASKTGTVTIGGGATQSITKTGPISLKGGTQTTGNATDFTAPNAGKLKLVAQVRGDNTATSDGFSVAAIPSGATVTFKSLIDTGTPGRRGFKVLTTFTSDSGNVADIYGIDVSEEVKYQMGTGVFADVTGDNSGYLTITMGQDMVDSHSTPTSLITAVGMIQAFQTFKFRDHRTGAQDIPMPNSGFIVTRQVVANGAKFDLITTKEGAKTTANGIASDAGTAIDDGVTKTITRTQTV